MQTSQLLCVEYIFTIIFFLDFFYFFKMETIFIHFITFTKKAESSTTVYYNNEKEKKRKLHCVFPPSPLYKPLFHKNISLYKRSFFSLFFFFFFLLNSNTSLLGTENEHNFLSSVQRDFIDVSPHSHPKLAWIKEFLFLNKNKKIVIWWWR